VTRIKVDADSFGEVAGEEMEIEALDKCQFSSGFS